MKAFCKIGLSEVPGGAHPAVRRLRRARRAARLRYRPLPAKRVFFIFVALSRRFLGESPAGDPVELLRFDS